MNQQISSILHISSFKMIYVYAYIYLYIDIYIYNDIYIYIIETDIPEITNQIQCQDHQRGLPNIFASLCVNSWGQALSALDFVEAASAWWWKTSRQKTMGRRLNEWSI